MTESQARIRVAALPEAVFDFVDDWRNTLRYLRRVDRWEPVDPEASTGVGSVLRIGIQAGPDHLDGRLELTEHERPKRLAFRSLDGPRVEWSWTFAPSGSGTDVVLDVLYELPGGIVGMLAGTFIRINARGDLEESLAELKRLVESGG